MNLMFMKKVVGAILLIFGSVTLWNYFTQLALATRGTSQLILGIIAVAIGVFFHAS